MTESESEYFVVCTKAQGTASCYFLISAWSPNNGSSVAGPREEKESPGVGGRRLQAPWLEGLKYSCCIN